MKLEIRILIKRKIFKDLTWSLSELKRLYYIINYVNKNKIIIKNSFYTNILKFKENKLKSWVARYKRIEKYGSTRTTLYMYLLKYGKNVGTILYNEKNIKHKFNSSLEGLIHLFGEEKANDIIYKRGTAFRNSEIQRRNSEKFAKKRKDNPELYTDILTTQIGYYLKQGYSEDESQELLSERQRTFSLDKCIDKYGIETGTEVFNQRQSKWQETLNNKSQEEKDEINKNKSCVLIKESESKIDYYDRLNNSVNNIIYDETDCKEFINSFYNDNLKYKFLCKEYFIKDLPMSIYNVIDKDNISDYLDNLKLTFPDKNLIRKNGRFFQKRIPEGLLRSSLEITFHEELIKRNIQFKLEKFYDINIEKLKSDFYIVEYDIHIEIAGDMKNETYINKMKYKEEQYDALILEPSKFKEFFKRIDTHGFEGIKNYIRRIV